MNLWTKVAVLSVGGVLGVNARYWQSVWMLGWVSPRFPWATFSINVIGCFLIGALSLILLKTLPHPHAWTFIIVGFLGGYTTFSSFALDALLLIEQKRVGVSLIYLVGSVVAGIIAVALGAALARVLLTWFGIEDLSR